MEVFEAITKRYSVRSYRSDPVEPEKLHKVLEAACQAPTACNFQAFRIVVIKTEVHKEELKTVYSKEWFLDAPYVLAVCSIPSECYVRKDGKNYSDVDAAIVMDHIILAATELGLGTCWIAAFDPQAARRVFQLEDSMTPVVLTPLGYPNDQQPTKRRKTVDALVTFIE